MKFLTALLFTIVYTESYSQILANVSLYVVGTPITLNKKDQEHFRQTETIFILSDVYSKEEYEQVLKDSWKITPYRILTQNEVNLDIYTNPKYSIAQLRYTVERVYLDNGVFSYPATYIDIMTMDTDKIKATTKNDSPEKLAKWTDNILTKRSTLMARVFIYAKDDFTLKALERSQEANTNLIFTEEVLYNYNPGFLKNYFQKINDVFERNEVCSELVGVSLPELENLARSILYIPSYATEKVSEGKKVSDKNDEQEVVEEYDYPYEIIDGNEIGNKIMNKEEFYYLRYARQLNLRYFQIVNSLTGEIIYSDSVTGFSRKLKPRMFINLNQAIAESLNKNKK